MARFTFRAQVALDLRRRQLDDALRELADAERVRDVARARVEQATVALAHARIEGTARARQSGTITDWHWYRIWIVRLEHERQAEMAILAAREASVDKARASVWRARQKHEALDALRVKARQAFDRTEAERERKLIDELATRRYVIDARAV